MLVYVETPDGSGITIDGVFYASGEAHEVDERIAAALEEVMKIAAKRFTESQPPLKR